MKTGDSHLVRGMLGGTETRSSRGASHSGSRNIGKQVLV